VTPAVDSKDLVASLIDARWNDVGGAAWARVDLGFTEQGLADAIGVQCDRAFRTRLWSAREAFREVTGRQIVIERERLIVLSAEEQARYSRRQADKAKRKKIRALDVAASVPVEHLPEVDRARHVRRIEHMAHSVALEKLASGSRNVLVGLGEEIVAQTRARQDEARSRAEAKARLWGKS
jgi:hypothetical protein